MDCSKIKNMLYNLGYNSRQFSDDYWIQIDGTSALKFDSIAFSNENIQDVSTSCIAIQEVSNEQEEEKYVANAKFAATPILILTHNENVQVWNITSDKQKLIARNNYDLIYLYFEKNRFEFMSENLVEAKYGIRQVTLFEAMGLIDFTRNVTCKILSDEFMKGLVAGKLYLKSIKKSKGQDLNNLTSITMHVLSALIINSKISNNEEIPDIYALLKNLSERYINYFSDKLMYKYGKELIKKIYDSMNASINYKSVDHELLGYFYETTLLQVDKVKADNLRKEFGIYYTPRYLSDEIINAIPIETLQPENRKVFDGSCGSGSLLISACKKLEKLLDEEDGFVRHNYLTNSIAGYDIDRFASEVARLSLLLYSLPYGNRWNIKSADLVKITDYQEVTPTIILGNPPYEEKRGNHVKSQKATDFLDRYMKWVSDDGFIGIILPESFMQNDSAIETRKTLLNNFDIFEIWSLPGTIFENNCSTIVIIAKKVLCSRAHGLTKVKILTRNTSSISNYLVNRKWDFTFYVDMQHLWRDDLKAKIYYSPIGNILKKIMQDNSVTLNDITSNITGLMLPSEYDGYSATPYYDWVPYISNADDFQKYYMSDEMMRGILYFNYEMSSADIEVIKSKYNYNGLRLRKKSKSLYQASKKVLVKMSSTPGEINCISALIDDKKVFPSHSFFALVSNDEDFISSEVICALINSKIINAYVRMYCVKRTLTTDIIRSIPIPSFTVKQKEELIFYVNKIKEALDNENEDAVNEYQDIIDNIVNDGFELDSEEKKMLLEYYNIYTNVDRKHTSETIEIADDLLSVTGEVRQINIKEQTCLLYIVEENDDVILPISEDMPGWFLREGMQFSARYNYNSGLTDIKPLRYLYMDYEEVINEFEKSFLEFSKEAL